MSEIKIDKKLPIPLTAGSRGQCIYPFAKMEVGDSFQIPEGKLQSVQTVSRYQGLKLGKKFTVRKYEGGYRCWRTK